MSVTEVGTPAAVQVSSGNTASVTGLFTGSQPRTAGDYLVAVVTTWGTTTGVISSFTAGWTQQVVKTSSTSRLVVAIYTKVAAGGDAAPTMTPANTGTTTAAFSTMGLFEFTGQDSTTPIATTGTGDGTASPITITSGANVTRTGSYAVSSVNAARTSAGTGTYTAGTSWTNVFNEGAVSKRPHAAADTFSNPPTGGTLSESPTWSGGTISEFTGCLIVIQPPAPPAVAPALPARPLRGQQAAARGKLASILIKPPTTGGPAAPFFPPRVLLRGAMAAVKGKLASARGRPGVPAPFTPPRAPLKGRAAARPGRLTGIRGRPGISAPFTPPQVLRPPPGLAVKGKLTAARGRPGVPAPFRLPGPLHGQPAARPGTLTGVVAPPPIVRPNVPAPFFAPHTLLRGQAGVRARTPLTGIVAPPPPPPPAQVPRWQGSTHMPAAGQPGNLILGANHTGTGGPGADLKGDFERSGD